MKSETITNLSSRRYDDACGTALALEFLGERWSLLVIRELMFGPRRFGEIRANLPGISANVLTQRLAGLEAAGILGRRMLPSPARVQVYELTPWGLEAGPVIRTMGAWAARSPLHDPLLFMSPASAMMSLATLGDPSRLHGVPVVAGFRFPDDAFVVTATPAGIAVERAAPDATALLFSGDTMAMRRTVYGKAPLSAAGAGGTLAVSGDMAAAARFVDLFHLPAKSA